MLAGGAIAPAAWKIPHTPMQQVQTRSEAPGKNQAVEPALLLRRRPGRPTFQQARDLRESILDAALTVFLAHGFEAASLEGVARRAGVAKLTLYRHFESKDELFVQVAQRAQLRVRGSLNVKIERAAPLEQVLRESISRLHEGFTQPDYLDVMRLVIAEARRFPKLGRAMLDDAKFAARPLVDYLSELKKAGEVNIDSPADAATQLAGLASGAGRYVLIRPSRHPASRRRTVDSLVALFSRAWGQTRGRAIGK